MSASTPSTTTPVSTLRVHVVLPKAVVKAIDQLVGQRNRSRFLTAAAEREISHRAFIEAASRTRLAPAYLVLHETVKARPFGAARLQLPAP